MDTQKEENDSGNTNTNANTNSFKESGDILNDLSDSSSLDSNYFNKTSCFLNNQQRYYSLCALNPYYSFSHLNPNDSNFYKNINGNINEYPRANSNPLPFNDDINKFNYKVNNMSNDKMSHDVLLHNNKKQTIKLKYEGKNAKKKKSVDIPKNKIHLENILRQKDKRTTIMIRNIPNKFLLNQFLEETNQEFKYKYNVIYFPSDKFNKCNLGYGFINFINSMDIISFYDLYFGQRWNKFNSDKRCELVYSKIQGRAELIKYIEKSNENDIDNIYIEPKSIKTDIVIPLRYLQAFLTFYPYSLYNVITNDKFIVHSFFNF